MNDFPMALGLVMADGPPHERAKMKDKIITAWLVGCAILLMVLATGCASLGERGALGAAEDAGVVKGAQADIARRVAALLVGKGETNPVKGIVPVDQHFVAGQEIDPASYMFKRTWTFTAYGPAAVEAQLRQPQAQDDLVAELMQILQEEGFYP